MTEDEWILDYLFSHQRTGVKPRELFNKSKMWGFDSSYIKKYVKDMIHAGRLLVVKGKLYPAQNEYGRELKKMYARNKIAKELLSIAKELIKEN
jgi:hypothetical protein